MVKFCILLSTYHRTKKDRTLKLAQHLNVSILPFDLTVCSYFYLVVATIISIYLPLDEIDYGKEKLKFLGLLTYAIGKNNFLYIKFYSFYNCLQI